MEPQDSSHLLSKTDNLKELFMNLSIAVSNNKHEEVIELSDRIRGVSVSDKKSIKSKIIALIKLDRYSEALYLIESEGYEEEEVLEMVYCMFMLKKYEEAMNIAKKSNKRGIKHIMAQIAYQKDQMGKASEIYKELQKDQYRIENEEFDLCINLLATQVTSSSIEISSQAAIYQSLDYRFNIGCHLICRKEYMKAKELFELSKEQCLSTSEEEMESILDPILVQLAYIYSCIGRELEAISIYEDLMNKSQVDQIIKLICMNNYYSIKSDTNPYLILHSLNTVLSKVKLSKLTDTQNKIIDKNIAILNILCEKYSACHNIVKKLQDRYPDDDSIILILVSSIISRFTGNRAYSELIKLHEKDSSNVTLSLAIIRFMILCKDNYNIQKITEKLLDSLKDNKSMRYKPELVRLLVEIYEKRGRKDLSRQELYAASEYWRSVGSNDPNLIELLYESGKLKLKRMIKNKESNLSPADDFKYILKLSPNNKKALAGLVIYYLDKDISEASKYANKLPSLDILTQGINVDHLEKSGIVNHSLEEKKSNHSKSLLKQKRKKSKLPKNYDPDKQPDPKRWISKKQNNYYKSSKGKRRQSNKTQGELVVENNFTTNTGNT
ncbi:hypothetical protein T552_01181 [Pneumocystis carinii B80]|uniref:Signal recognition particle subunit SRP72 n=1 Tax=Pneumocystis carinii (strain B80) TaxID=1408658 RepID=A0A0W4ZLH1_PNEC8|nr:hypothetical protein T552_01181 [Pneumocystis carinii B80]KTW29225.1 hypothetical protein T552_01181 [Pneumocystis carinii B80]